MNCSKAVSSHLWYDNGLLSSSVNRAYPESRLLFLLHNSHEQADVVRALLATESDILRNAVSCGIYALRVYRSSDSGISLPNMDDG